MSAKELASLVNECHAKGDCLVSENWDNVLLSRLSADLTQVIAGLATTAAFDHVILNGANHDIALADVDEVGQPYRISLSKKVRENYAGCVLTLRGMDDLLFDIGERTVIYVADLRVPFGTIGVQFVPWEEDAVPHVYMTPLKSPRNFVREYGNQRLAPTSISPWILQSPIWLGEEPVFVRWATLATRQCLLALSNEVQEDPLSIVFKGPPRGTTAPPDLSAGIDEALYSSVQACASWVYEAPTETEMRHPLLSAEVARFSSSDGLLEILPSTFASALDGARLAYDLGISKLSSDTLKMLTDLRKSVLDEATKISDGTRQLIASVAATLSLGIGLIAAKVGANADGSIIGAVAFIAFVYVATIICAGHRALALQDSIRDQWKPRTYGFISRESYEKLVDQPAKKAAESYRSVARISLYLTGFMLTVVVWSIATFR